MTSSSIGRIRYVVTWAWVIVGCSGGEPTNARTAVYDSSGVQIISTQPPHWSETDKWMITEKPLLSIGSGDSMPLAGVTDATRLSDGTIVIAHRSRAALEYFDSLGNHIRRVGRKGEGPGEFGSGILRIAQWSTDTVLAPSPTRQAYQLFDRRGALVRRIPRPGLTVPRNDAYEWEVIWSAEGKAVVTGMTAVTTVDGRTLGGDSLLIQAADDIGTARAAVLAREWTVREGREPQLRYPDAPILMAYDRGILYVALDHHSSILLYDVERADGTSPQLIRVIRYGWQAPAINGEVLERLRNNYANLWGTDETRPWRLEQFSSLPISERLPAYDDMLVDEGGNLWLARFTEGSPSIKWPPPADYNVWDVYDPAAGWMGEVELPIGFWPFEIGKNWILGVSRDELDRAIVNLYRIQH